jgi:hypothetical protein
MLLSWNILPSTARGMFLFGAKRPTRCAIAPKQLGASNIDRDTHWVNVTPASGGMKWAMMRFALGKHARAIASMPRVGTYSMPGLSSRSIDYPDVSAGLEVRLGGRSDVGRLGR